MLDKQDTAAIAISTLDTLDHDDVGDTLVAHGFDADTADRLADTIVCDPDLDWLTGDQRTEHVAELIGAGR